MSNPQQKKGGFFRTNDEDSGGDDDDGTSVSGRRSVEAMTVVNDIPSRHSGSAGDGCGSATAFGDVGDSKIPPDRRKAPPVASLSSFASAAPVANVKSDASVSASCSAQPQQQQQEQEQQQQQQQQQQQKPQQQNNKDKDKPKRPLSAYNLFFQHERDRLLRGIQSPFGYSHDANHCTLGRDPSQRADRSKKVRPPPHGKIGFAELARTIGARWKSADERTREYYDKLAEQEKERYRAELEAWRSKRVDAADAEADAATSAGNTTAFVDGGGRVHQQPQHGRSSSSSLGSATDLATTSAPEQGVPMAFASMYHQHQDDRLAAVGGTATEAGEQQVITMMPPLPKAPHGYGGDRQQLQPYRVQQHGVLPHSQQASPYDNIQPSSSYHPHRAPYIHQLQQQQHQLPPPPPHDYYYNNNQQQGAGGHQHHQLHQLSTSLAAAAVVGGGGGSGCDYPLNYHMAVGPQHQPQEEINEQQDALMTSSDATTHQNYQGWHHDNTWNRQPLSPSSYNDIPHHYDRHRHRSRHEQHGNSQAEHHHPSQSMLPPPPTLSSSYPMSSSTAASSLYPTSVMMYDDTTADYAAATTNTYPHQKQRTEVPSSFSASSRFPSSAATGTNGKECTARTSTRMLTHGMMTMMMHAERPFYNNNNDNDSGNDDDDDDDVAVVKVTREDGLRRKDKGGGGIRGGKDPPRSSAGSASLATAAAATTTAATAAAAASSSSSSGGSSAVEDPYRRERRRRRHKRRTTKLKRRQQEEQQLQHQRHHHHRDGEDDDDNRCSHQRIRQLQANGPILSSSPSSSAARWRRRDDDRLDEEEECEERPADPTPHTAIQNPKDMLDFLNEFVCDD